MRYGIPYKGCKSKYAEQILSYIPSADNFYDLFEKYDNKLQNK